LVSVVNISIEVAVMTEPDLKTGKAPETASKGRAARGPRSPNFPAIPLADAIAKARKLYEKDKRASVSVKTVLVHLGFGEKLSGSSARVISALRQFGLLEEVGGQFRVTEAAARIFTLSEASPERTAAIQGAARKPAIYKDILGHYPDGLPSDAALGDYLILEKKFNSASVETFIRVFKASNEFAKLTPGRQSEPKGSEPAPPDPPEVGDFVQWESQGVLQFEARKVIGISPGRDYVFVEGSSTGIAVDQVRKVEPPPVSKKAPVGVAREVSSLEEGEAMLQWPAVLSPNSVVELEDWLSLVVKKLKRRYGAE
jgi:hypothetical protein